MPEITPQVWKTCGYVRLSREDGDKEESNSVTGQKELIRDYLSQHPELQECGMKVDDGYTGSNFDRPGFREMMDDVRAGRVNCIVVKDLSRFGRDHLGAGEYLEKIFPFLKVRFIAINDHYDSLHHTIGVDDLIVPMKNLINEAYCRDASIKTRSQLEVKRKRGDFIGSFAAFGYKKDPEDHNRLVVDEAAADVVRNIFQWKLEGISTGDIADRLNAAGVLTPMDYKISQGLRYTTKFRTKQESAWCAKMVIRILQNPIYTGTLEQGRTTTPSYNVKRLVNKPREEWAIIENHHEAIISSRDFGIIQKVLALDTRTGVGGQPVALFSGMLFCGECGGPMIRKPVPSGRKRYVYYVCAAHKNDKTCYAHSMRDNALEEIVLESLQQRIRDVIDLSDIAAMSSSALLQQASIQRVRKRLAAKEAEIERYQSLLCSLYENLIDGVIEREEYHELKKSYTRRRAEAEEQADDIREELNKEISGVADNQGWMEQFRKYRNITALDRALVVTLIERINIYREHRVEIVFRWQNEYQWLASTLDRARRPLSRKEAV